MVTADESPVEETPTVENVPGKPTADAYINGLTGDFALQTLSKRAKKKFLDEKRKKEEEE